MSSRDDGRIQVCVRVRDVSAFAANSCGVSNQAPGPQSHADANAINGVGAPGFTTPRVRRTATGMGSATPNKSGACTSLASPMPSDPTAVCVSTLENVVVMHDPRTLQDGASIARDATTLIQALKARGDGSTEPLPASRHAANPQSAVGGCTANYFECDHCIVSMAQEHARQMPIIRDSDFLQPPPYGKQEDVYQCTAAHAVEAALEGINSCVFAYGQTGSGKTFTLFGDTAAMSREPGVVLRSVDDLFRRLEARKSEADADMERSQVEYAYAVSLSFFEIYQTDVTCLLSKKGPLKVLVTDGPPVIQDLDIRNVTSFQQAAKYVEVGLRRRQTGETGMNAKSSRSHAIVQITLQQYRTNKRTKETVEFTSVINMVDLAGSERQRTAKTDGKSRTEGIQINQSLTVLARVINEISKGSKFVNYRDSMLTLLLRENLGGNSKTFMIATVNPTANAYHESCATLQYAKHVRMIRNRPKVNKTFQTRGHLQEINLKLKEENEQLRAQIETMIAAQQETSDSGDAANGGADALLTDALGAADDGASAAAGHRAVDRPHFARMETMHRLEEELKAGNNHQGRVCPLLVSTKRVTSTSGAIPFSRTEGRVNITPLDRDTMELDLSSFFSSPLPRGKSSLILESITQRSMETTYWVRSTIAAHAGDPNDLRVEINGRQLLPNEPFPLSHGDVLVVAQDHADVGEEELIAVHFVDLTAMGRNGSNAGQPTAGGASGTVALSLTEKDGRISQLEKEVSKLLDLVAHQSRTIEYQCQKQNAINLRAGTVTANPSRATSAAPSSDGASVATIASPDIRRQFEQLLTVADNAPPQLDGTVLLDSFNHAARPSTSTSRSELGSLSPPTAGNSRPMTALNASRASSATRHDETTAHARYEAALEENRKLQLRLAECQDAMSSLEMDNGALLYRIERMEERGAGASDADNQQTPRFASTVRTPRCPLPSSMGESPMRSSPSKRLSAFPEGEPSANELRERLLASKRERALRSEVAKLEANIDDLQQQLRSVERMMDDAASEHSIVLHEAQSEAAELSRALLCATGEYDNVHAQLLSLQDLARQAEDALTEVGLTAEAELERRLTHLCNEKNALATLCKTWKYRAVHAQTKLSVFCATEETSASIAAQSQGTIDDVLKRVIRGRGSASSSGAGDTDDAITALLETVEAESHAEIVDVLKTNVRELEREKMQLKDQLHHLGTDLEHHRLHINELEDQKSKLEREKHTGDDKLRAKTLTALKKKSEELIAAEKLRDDLAVKLELALNGKQRLQQRVQAANDLLRDEQKKTNLKLQEQVARLAATVSQQEEEMAHMQRLVIGGDGGGGGEDLSRIRQQLETLLEAPQPDHAAGAHTTANHPASLFARTASAFSSFTSSDQYNAFPKHFVFSDEVVACTRICLRLLMDRMKVELYVMNKATTQSIAAILPTVQYRADAVFQSSMTDLRRVVSTTTKCAQRIGCAWSAHHNGEGGAESIARQLGDTDRRSVHKALLGLLLWYDHWDMVTKRDNGSYIELIRNAEVVLALARLVRAESRTPTNALFAAAARLSVSDAPTTAPTTGSKVGGDVARLPDDVDPTVREGRRVLAHLQKMHNESNLTKHLKSPVKRPTAAAASFSPDATPPPGAGKARALSYATAEHCQPLDWRSKSSAASGVSPPSTSHSTARHRVSTEDAPAAAREAPVQPLTDADVDTALKFTRQQSAAVFSVKPDALFATHRRSVSGHQQRTAATGNGSPHRSSNAELVKKRLSRMTEDELVNMVVKDKKKIFGLVTSKSAAEGARKVNVSDDRNAEQKGTKKASQKEAVMSFFRTMSPPKSKILSTLAITSPSTTNTNSTEPLAQQPTAEPRTAVPVLHLSKLK